MKQSQTGIRKVLSRISTPETIGVLVICFYVINWLIYPEALEYMKMTAGQSVFGVIEGAPIHLNDLPVYIINSEGRTITGVVEVGIGSLRAIILFAILYSSSIYVYKYTRARWARRTFMPLLIALVLHFLHLLSLIWMLATYPSLFNIKILVSAILYYSSVAIAGAVAIALGWTISGILYKRRVEIIDSVYTSLQLFRKR